MEESWLPSTERDRRKLIEKIRQTAIEIEYAGRGNTDVLAQVLDHRGIHPLRGGKWDSERGFGDSATTLRYFIKRHLPDLWPNGVKTTVEPVCLCSQCGVARQGSCERFHSPDPPLDNAQLDNLIRQRPVSKLSNPVSNERRTLDGWTIRQDNHGYCRAYRKVNGKLKSVYLGKSLDEAQAKIAKAIENAGKNDRGL